MSIRDRAALGFVLGKMLDDADRFDEAFAHYARANSLVLQMRRAAGERYDSDRVCACGWMSRSRCSRRNYLRNRGSGASPRNCPSSSWECRAPERALSNRSPPVTPMFSAPASSGTSATSRLRWVSAQYKPESIKDAARKQLDHLRVLGGSALRVIDKMPANVEHLGLIATLFPSARVIFCRRDPRDTCLSCFFQHFSAGNLFSFDLAQCGRHHVHTDRLIAHWLKVLPLRMLQVQYEDLVADLEGQSRRIISFLGLPWNPACLDFHRTERTVQTASDWQVRQPIYTRSVGRWRNYERHLGPLLKALG